MSNGHVFSISAAFGFMARMQCGFRAHCCIDIKTAANNRAPGVISVPEMEYGAAKLLTGGSSICSIPNL
jgi:hypothetical protein